jgi:LytR cell envelope-related transcriptional attenuator
VAKGGSPLGRIAIGLLALLVLALIVSWGYARFAPKPGPRTAGPAHQVIRIQVLNGSGEGGIGGKVASFLREGGFHVVEVKNADRQDYGATLVVARRDEPVAAEAVAHYLGDPPMIRQTWGSDLADVTVVIGSDRSRLRLEP